MNTTVLARIIGSVVLLLGVVGLLSGDTQLLRMMNTDIMLDVLRIALGGILLASSYKGEGAQKKAFALFGAVYLANFLAAMVSPTMFGLLPHTFGVMDNMLHLVGGLLGLALAFWPSANMHTRHSI